MQFEYHKKMENQIYFSSLAPGFVMPDQQQCYPALPVRDPAPTLVNVHTQQAPAPQVIVVGGCPSCRVSRLDYMDVYIFKMTRLFYL